jgi:alpha-L-fucosidase
MNRREFIKTLVMPLAASIYNRTGPVHIEDSSKQNSRQLPLPSPAQCIWQDCEVGVIFHFDLAIAASVFAPNNTVKRKLNTQLYQPHQLDTDQWVETAKAAGAKYAIFTATHFNGFMQWQSDLYPYGLKQTSWRNHQADVVADFVTSCRKADIKPGLYFSTHRNAYWTVWGHYVDWGQGKDTAKQAQFNRIAEKMTEELCSRYGPLLQIWYDAGVKTPAEGGPNVLPIFEKHQPDSVFYHSKERSDYRWIGNEDGHAGYPCWATMPGPPASISHNSPQWKPFLYKGDPSGTIWSPGMVDVPLRGANRIHNWFWHPNQDHGCHSTEALIKMYNRSVGRNCNFVIGAVVTPSGLVPESDRKRLAEFGRAIDKRFRNPIGETQGSGMVLTLSLEQPKSVNQIVIMEDITQGQRIRAYRIEGRSTGTPWKTICEGQSIGHKRIQCFPDVTVKDLRLNVTEAFAPPQIRKLSVFHTEA